MKYIVIVFSGWLLFSSCSHQKEAKKTAAETGNTDSYHFAKVEPGSLSSSIALPGQLQPYEMVQLYPKVNSFVTKVFVDRGSVVHTGQVLMQLEAPEIQEQYLAAKSKAQQALSMYFASKDNYERLFNTSQVPGTVSPNDLEMAHSKMIADSAIAEAEKSTYKSLQATLDYLVVKAPFDGVITERNVHPGALVGPNIKADDKPMLVLQQENRLRLVIDVPEQYATQLDNKTTFSFRLNSLPGKIFYGTISRASGALNAKFRSETAEIDVFNKDGFLKPGMYAEVLLPVSGSTGAWIVPKSAIVTSTERKYVITVNDNKTKWVDVTEGNSRNDSTEVFGQLNTGAKIVANANDEIKEGQLIK